MPPSTCRPNGSVRKTAVIVKELNPKSAPTNETLLPLCLLHSFLGAGGGAGWEAQWLSESPPVGPGRYHPNRQPLVLEVASERQRELDPGRVILVAVCLSSVPLSEANWVRLLCLWAL